jgi:hypothetical protein
MSKQDDTQDNKFDLRQFNKEFVKKKEQTKLDNKIKSQKKLNLLTEQANIEHKAIYNQSVWEILVGVKNTWFDILDDILAKKISLKLFTKDNRLFYIGITIIIIVLLLYLYNFFIDDNETDEPTNKEKVIVEKYYIYNDSNKQSINIPFEKSSKSEIFTDKNIQQTENITDQ